MCEVPHEALKLGQGAAENFNESQQKPSISKIFIPVSQPPMEGIPSEIDPSHHTYPVHNIRQGSHGTTEAHDPREGSEAWWVC